MLPRRSLWHGCIGKAWEVQQIQSLLRTGTAWDRYRLPKGLHSLDPSGSFIPRRSTAGRGEEHNLLFFMGRCLFHRQIRTTSGAIAKWFLDLSYIVLHSMNLKLQRILNSFVEILFPDTTHGTAIGLPISWGGAMGVFLGRQSGLAVPWSVVSGMVATWSDHRRFEVNDVTRAVCFGHMLPR